MNIPELYTLYKQYPDVSTDSRTCRPGSLFFALRGASFDGNAYAADALRAGCPYAVIDDPSLQGDKRMIHVGNVLDTLQQLARFHREALRLTVIGITGTNGKTTTRELTARVLSKKYGTLSTEGNLNNHIGVPLTLLRLTARHEIAVVEMGASRPGEIRDLAAIARPNYGIVTNVGYAHLEGFGSPEGVVRAKGELYDFIRETGGKIFLDGNNKHLAPIARGIENISYGNISDEATPEAPVPSVRGEAAHGGPCLSFRWQQHAPGRPAGFYTVKTRLAGGYNLYNALAAVAAGLHFGIPPGAINEAIASCEPANSRSQLKETPGNTLLIDAYNANPSSMRAALEHFASSRNSLSGGREANTCGTHDAQPCAPRPKAVILGDMLELGEKSGELHEAVLSLAAACGFDRILLCGEYFSAAGMQYDCFATVEELSRYLRAHPLKGYDILIKGSHGMHLERIIEHL
jgi:UDP-N-acetylmuramoyl-tripeptide--D-alanyl-D-alanine ligase